MSKTIVSLAAIFILASVHLAETQQTKKVPRIGFLNATSLASAKISYEAFRQGLREIGYAEGKNITIEYRFAEGREDRLRQFASELVQLKVDVIYTGGTA